MCTKDDFIELMMGADTPLEALSIYYGGMKHLENCQFIFFDFSQGNCPIPNLVNSEYMEPSKGPGYAIQTLSCNENFWVLDKKCFYEMMRHQKSDVLLKVCLDFDTQMLTYLEKYHSDQAATPQSLHKLLSEVESAGVDYSCAPYAIENSYKIGDPKIEQGMVRSLVAFSHYKNNPFDFYKTLRNKFIAHDGSRYANATTGAILDSSKERPLLDVVTAAWVADNYTSENGLAAMQTFYHLVLVTIEWVEAKIDELGRLLKKQYGDKPMSAFRDFPPLQVEVPTQEKLFEKRY